MPFLPVIPFPAIDPVIIDLPGPLALRWYSLLWLLGCLAAWAYVRWFVKAPPHALTAQQAGDFLVWGILGTVLGGRIGYVTFYAPGMVAHDPLSVFAIWDGGMSFHGGLIGVVAAVWLFVRRHGLVFYAVSDALCTSAPLGLFCVRIANFINGELWGRVTDVPWAMVFPRGGPEPRHPSQLYEAALEGVVLFIILHTLSRFDAVRTRPGILTGAFFIGYGIFRALVELVRQPDVQLGFLAFGLTMGQWLSLPVLLAGLYFILRAVRAGKGSA